MIGDLFSVKLGGTLLFPTQLAPAENYDDTKTLYYDDVVLVLSLRFVSIHYSECQVLTRHGLGYVGQSEISRLS
jgi:hypothetical protein